MIAAAHGAGGGKGEEFALIVAGADGGGDDAELAGNHGDGGDGKGLGGHADDDEGAAFAEVFEGGVVGLDAGGGDDGDVGAVGFFGAGPVGAALAGEGELVGAKIDRRDSGAAGGGDLNGEVTQAADAEDGDALPGAERCLLEPPVNGNAGAQQRGGVGETEAVRQRDDVGGFRLDEFGVTAIDGDAGDALAPAEHLAPLPAVFAFAAGPVEPGNANAIAGVNGGDVRAGGVDDAGDFVPQDEREFGVAFEEVPIGGGKVEIGVADAAGVDFDEHLV